MKGVTHVCHDDQHVTHPHDKAHSLAVILSYEWRNEGMKQVPGGANAKVCHGKPKVVWTSKVISQHHTVHLLLTPSLVTRI